MKNLRVRSRVGVASHEVHALRLGSTKDGYLEYKVLADFYISGARLGRSLGAWER